VVGGRVGRYQGWSLHNFWSFFFFPHLLHSNNICLHIMTPVVTARPLPSVILQGFRLDLAPQAASCLIYLIGWGRAAVTPCHLLQTDSVLGFGQRAVNAGFILEGRGRGRPWHACQSGTFCLRACPWREGAAYQRGASLSRHASSSQGRKPAGQQRGNLEEEQN